MVSKNKIISIVVLTFLFFPLSCATVFRSTGLETEKKEELALEKKYGRLLAKKIFSLYPLYHNKQANFYLNQLGQSVALFSGRSHLNYRFAILEAKSVFAWASPGGYVFISKGALKKMQNEAELAGVLAHQIAHLNYAHLIKKHPPPQETINFIDKVVTFLLTQGSLVSEAFKKVVDESLAYLRQGFGIEDEYQADLATLYYLDEAGYQAKAYLDFLKRVNSEKNTKDLKKRIRRLNNILRQHKFSLKKPLVKDRFRARMRSVK